MKGSCDSCQAQENAPTSVRDFTGPQDIGGLPEHIEAELKPSSKATCVASNRWGTMLAGAAHSLNISEYTVPFSVCFIHVTKLFLRCAVGCEDGTTAVYDMITRGEACVYPPSSAECAPQPIYRPSGVFSTQIYASYCCRDIAEVTAVAFYRYGSCLVTGHANGLVITRDICQNVEVRHACSFSPTYTFAHLVLAHYRHEAVTSTETIHNC